MKRLVYIVDVELTLFDGNGKEIGYDYESPYYTTLDEMFKAVYMYKREIGRVWVKYIDGTYSVVRSVEYWDEPLEVDFMD